MDTVGWLHRPHLESGLNRNVSSWEITVCLLPVCEQTLWLHTGHLSVHWFQRVPRLYNAVWSWTAKWRRTEATSWRLSFVDFHFCFDEMKYISAEWREYQATKVALSFRGYFRKSVVLKNLVHTYNQNCTVHCRIHVLSDEVNESNKKTDFFSKEIYSPVVLITDISRSLFSCKYQLLFLHGWVYNYDTT